MSSARDLFFAASNSIRTAKGTRSVYQMGLVEHYQKGSTPPHVQQTRAPSRKAFPSSIELLCAKQSSPPASGACGMARKLTGQGGL